MDVRTENLHMLMKTGEAASQAVVVGELTVPPQLPHADQILLEQGEVEVREITPAKDQVTLRGALVCHLLYRENEEGELECLTGELPFEETLPLAGAQPGDEIWTDTALEDITAIPGNGTKVNLRALILFTVEDRHLCDVPIVTGAEGEEKLEVRKEKINCATVLACKKEAVRIRKEIAIGASEPNIDAILWREICLQEMTERCEDGVLKIQGQGKVSALYRGEDRGNGCSVVPHESTFQIAEEIPVTGCKMGAVPYVCYQLVDKKVSVLPDLDGEERILLVEAMLSVSIQVYENREMDAFRDAYSTRHKLLVKRKPATLPNGILRVNGRSRIEKRMTTSVHREGETYFELLAASGCLKPMAMENQKDALVVHGILDVTALFVMEEDAFPYKKETFTIPYEYRLETGNIAKEAVISLHSRLESLNVSMGSNGVIDIQAGGYFQALICETGEWEQPAELVAEPFEKGELEAMPDMVVVRCKKGDDLWSIGKDYYIETQQVKQCNHLEEDALIPGQKLVLMRGNAI